MLLALAVGASAQTQSPLSTENIIVHMEQAAQYNHARFHPYVVTVDYRLFGNEAAVPTSRVIAELTFDPPYL
jgi:hypothetical protein